MHKTPWHQHIEDWTRHLRAAGCSDETIGLRRYHILRLAKALQQDLTTVTADDLETWLSNTEWTASYKRSWRASMRRFWFWALARGIVTESPAHLLPRVQVHRAIPRPVPVDVYAAALAIADERVTLALRLGRECALRRGEIARAKREDVERDLVGWAIRVRGKGDHVRLVPLPDDLAALLRARDPGWIFPSSARPSHLTPAHLGKLVSRTLEGEHATHSLRHRAATDSANGGADLRAVQEFLGHAQLNTVAIYTEVGRNQIRAAMEAAA